MARGKSWTSNSYHLKRLAVDFNIFINNKFVTFETSQYLGDFWEALSPYNFWGGYFRGRNVDVWHFERRDNERKVRLIV